MCKKINYEITKYFNPEERSSRIFPDTVIYKQNYRIHVSGDRGFVINAMRI
jgi:hypothetical protein